jgi:dienelactone hydrolase
VGRQRSGAAGLRLDHLTLNAVDRVAIVRRLRSIPLRNYRLAMLAGRFLPLLTLMTVIVGCAVPVDDWAAIPPEVVRIPVPETIPGGPITLEGFVYSPRTPGKHPVVVFNHGSADGEPYLNLPASSQAQYFVSRGFVVIVPMRRGRGSSGGVSSEGEDKNCDVTSWEPGLRAATDDITAAVDFATTIPNADTSRILLVGASRGGFLAVAYAASGARREAVVGVINFVGGWVAQAQDDCAEDFNVLKFRSFGQRSPVPQLWLYGDRDPYYSRESILSYARVFEDAGGTVRFELIENVPGNGHSLPEHPDLWGNHVAAYLHSIRVGRHRNLR